MIVKPNHRNVDPNGLICIPYLSQWRADSSLLPELLNQLTATFSREPPLFTKPTSPSPAPVTSTVSYGSYSAYQPPAVQAQPVPQSSAYGYSSAGTTVAPQSSYVNSFLSASTAAAGPTAARPPYNPTPPPSYSAANNNLYDPPPSYSSSVTPAAAVPPPPPSYQSPKAKKDELISAVTSKLQHEMHKYYSRVRGKTQFYAAILFFAVIVPCVTIILGEIDAEFTCQAELEERKVL